MKVVEGRVVRWVKEYGVEVFIGLMLVMVMVMVSVGLLRMGEG